MVSISEIDSCHTLCNTCVVWFDWDNCSYLSDNSFSPYPCKHAYALGALLCISISAWVVVWKPSSPQTVVTLVPQNPHWTPILGAPLPWRIPAQKLNPSRLSRLGILAILDIVGRVGGKYFLSDLSLSHPESPTHSLRWLRADPPAPTVVS